eukprot:1133392-Pelagomonas_calceolata.AAC.2
MHCLITVSYIAKGCICWGMPACVLPSKLKARAPGLCPKLRDACLCFTVYKHRGHCPKLRVAARASPYQRSGEEDQDRDGADETAEPPSGKGSNKGAAQKKQPKEAQPKAAKVCGCGCVSKDAAQTKPAKGVATQGQPSSKDAAQRKLAEGGATQGQPRCADVDACV